MTAISTVARQDDRLNALAIDALALMAPAAIRSVLTVADDASADLQDLHSLEVDGTDVTLVDADGRIESAVNVHWTWSAGDASMSGERSGTAYGQLVDGLPVFDRIVIDSLLD